MTHGRRVAHLEVVRPEAEADRAAWRKLVARYRAMSPAELDNLLRQSFQEDPADQRWQTMTETEIDQDLHREMAGFTHQRNPR